MLNNIIIKGNRRKMDKKGDYRKNRNMNIKISHR